MSPSIIVIFGITGDLAQRKLLPALYHLYKEDLLDPSTVILGITRRDVTADELLAKFKQGVSSKDEISDPAILDKVKTALRMHTMSQVDPDEYAELYDILNTIEEEAGVCMNRLYYLSIPPQMFGPIVRNLGQQGLNKSCQHGTAATRLLVEKPFGYDLHSAQELIDETGKWFSEDQMFRIDHYLAKNALQNITDFRRENTAVEGLWNGSFIRQIEITAYEQIGIEGRANFYEGVGALRDFIQSHLLQTLAVVIMDLPNQDDDSSSDAVHAARLAALESIAPITKETAADTAVRAQYAGYRDEAGVADSTTETFARVDLAIPAGGWQGTTMTLQTGKAMAEKRTDIRMHFRDQDAVLTFHIQPETGITLEGDYGESGILAALQSVVEAFNDAHPNTSNQHPDAYERVLLDAVRGNHELFTTADEVLASWRIVDGVLQAWSQTGGGLKTYEKGNSEIVRP